VLTDKAKGGCVNKRTIGAAGIALGVLLLVVGCIYVGNIHPVASFTVTAKSGNTPLDVDFDPANSSDADGTIETYYWDFGDGQTASSTLAQVVSNVFTVQSVSVVFRVVLTVTDNLGAEDQAVVDITVAP
jgi:hexosaminidase